MTLITDVGLEWISDDIVGEGEELDEIALGTGTSNESPSDTSLENEVFRLNVSDADASIVSTSNTGEIRAEIDITGGFDVSDGTEITEFGVFAEGGTGNEVLVVIDTFSAVEMKSGITESFVCEFTVSR